MTVRELVKVPACCRYSVVMALSVTHTRSSLLCSSARNVSVTFKGGFSVSEKRFLDSLNSFTDWLEVKAMAMLCALCRSAPTSGRANENDGPDHPAATVWIFSSLPDTCISYGDGLAARYQHGPGRESGPKKTGQKQLICMLLVGKRRTCFLLKKSRSVTRLLEGKLKTGRCRPVRSDVPLACCLFVR